MDSYLDCLTIQNISKLDINQDFAQKYYEYLRTLIQRNKPVDFIQAGNVMQTLSSVFARKVDHLQQQVLQFTVLFRRRELGNEVDCDALQDVENNNELETQDKDKAKSRKKSEKENLLNRFDDITLDINIIRKSCVKKFDPNEVKEDEGFLIRHRTYECPRVKTKDDFSCYIYDYKEEILGRKEEFSVNGILCNAVVPKDDFCLGCNHGEGMPTVDDSVFNIPPESHQISLAADSPYPDAMEIDNHDSNVDLPLAPDTHSYQNVVEEFLNNSLDESDTSGFMYFEKMNKVGEAVMDLEQMVEAVWKPIDDNNVKIERKLQIRNVIKLPDCLKKDDSKAQDKPYPCNYVLSDLLLSLYKAKSGLPCSRFCAKALQEEEEYRKNVIKKEKKKGRRRRDHHPVVETETEFRGFNEFADDDDHDAFECENDIAPFEDVMPSVSNDAPLQPSSVEPQDYLQGAIQNIEAYQKGLQDDNACDIAEKVSSWHDRIRPILEREEERTCFDIHEYGTKILDRFPKNNGKNTLSFANVVENETREEIPRLFLSSLLLANSHNVEISKDSPAELVVNDMNLTLLSRVRQHETLDEDMRKEYS